MVTKISKLRLGGSIAIERETGQSTADASQTVSTPSAGPPRRIKSVKVKYSAIVTEGVTITLNSGAGSAWDTLLRTIVLTSGTDGVWYPEGDEDIGEDDVIDVFAPAGGVGITSAIAIYTEAL